VLAVNKYDESGAQAGSALATVPSAGGELTYLTDFDSFAYYPTWNAKTNQIAFSTENYLYSTITDIYAKAWNLYTINPDGTSLTQLTDVDAGVHMMQPSWTPDGEKLLATAESGGNLVASWVDPATGDVTAITSGGRQTNVQQQPSSTRGSAGTGDPGAVQAQTAAQDNDESAMPSADDTPVADPANWVPHSSGRPW
jgi:Tol biopolymer transport system component